MANEGSTKPTYSELEAENETLRIALREIGEAAVCDWQDRLVGMVDAALGNDRGKVEYWTTARHFRDRMEAAETSLARVRGLLQRSQEFLRSAIKQAWLSNERQIKDFLKEAESADIGKLDAADKSDACNYSRFSEETGAMCSRGVRGCTGNHKSGVFYCRNNHDPCDESFSTEALRDEHESDCHEAFLKIYAGVEMGKVSSITFSQGAPPMAGTPSIASAGSAETGGEKAAPSKFEMACAYCEHFHYLRNPCAVVYGIEAIPCGCKFFVEQASPTFPRTSQNQTVSSGVEGAHEGTTADKSGSREPEKLYRCKNSDNLHAVMGVPCPDCKLEPEKLNNAPFDKTDDWEARQDAGRQVPNVAESSLSPPPRKLPVGKGLWEVPHFGCDYPQGGCDCYEGEASPELLPTQLPKEK